MKEEKRYFSMNRRKFNKLLMTSAIGGPFMLGSSGFLSKGSTTGDELVHRN